jgi:2-(1,2-epoxy-1,2-dihydrophenyl)acetyl-CoA isomerase
MSAVLVQLQQGVAIVTLNRPQKFNAFNQSMALLLQQVLNDCANNPTVRCIYLTGSGKAFSAGQDIAELVGPNPPGFETILKDHYNPIVSIIRSIPKPIVAAVNGVAAGAGANIALCCDVVVASQQASFIQAFSKIGLIPDSGGTFILPRLIGFQKASAMMMLADTIAAEEAERIGMIYKTFPHESFATASLQIATTLSLMPTKGLALTKQALNSATQNNFEQQLALEDALQYQAAHTADYQEGVQAFIDKRIPVFKGK